jgi:hypothetical protein
MFEVGNMRNAHLKTVRNLWKEYVITPNFHNESLIGFALVLLVYSLDVVQLWLRLLGQHLKRSTDPDFMFLPRYAYSKLPPDPPHAYANPHP